MRPTCAGCAHVGDDELTGIIKAWRRITSWGAARELAAVAELARRRPADIDDILDPEVAAQLRAGGGAAAAGSASPGLPGSTESPAGPGLPELVSPFVPDELVPALTMTVRAAELHLSLAADLATKLPMTAAALEAGLIDMVRARIIAEAARVLTRERAAAVEQLIFPRAEQQTSGQLRAALARAMLAADPDAARKRREQAQREARVLRWREDAGTAALSGRDLPSAEVLAADQRISARARELKSAGLAGTMDELRARAYLDFLLGRTGLPQPGISDPGAGQPAESTAGPDRPDTSPAGAGGRGTGPGGPAAGPWSPGGPPGGLAARINMTVPLSTLLGTSGTPGEVAAFGPVDAELARELARAAGTHPATRWCVTVTGQHGQAVGHGCARGRHSAPEQPPAGPQPPPAAPEQPPAGPQPPPAGPEPPPAGPERPAQDGPARDGPAPASPRPHHPAPDSSRRPEPAGRGPARDDPSGDGPARDRPVNRRAGPAEPVDPLNPLARAFLQRLRIRITPLAVGTCDHRNEEPGYKPSRLLRHLIEARTPRCTAPGCRRPAAQCDQDHTIPYQAWRPDV